MFQIEYSFSTKSLPIIHLFLNDFQFVRGGHKKGLVVVHTVADNFYLVIDDDELVKRLGNFDS